jgi:hypothetical protein
MPTRLRGGGGGGYGFGSGGGFEASVDLGQIKDAYNHFTGNTAQAYIQTDEAKTALVEGFAQIKRGEAPTRIIEFTQNLVGRGMGTEAADKITSSMLGHFHEAERNRKVGALQSELTGQPGTEEPVQLGGPGFDPSQGIAPIAQPAQPGRDLNQADVMGMLGPKAFDSSAGFGGLMAAPSAINENNAQAGNARAQADYHKVQAALKQDQQSALENLPNEVDPVTGISQRQLGQSTEGRGLAPVANQRLEDFSQEPERAARTRHINAQTGLETERQKTEGSRRGLMGAQAGAATASAGASRELGDLRKRTDPNRPRGTGTGGRAARDMTVPELQKSMTELTRAWKQADAVGDDDMADEIKDQMDDVRAALAQQQGTGRDRGTPGNETPEQRKKRLKGILSGR